MEVLAAHPTNYLLKTKPPAVLLQDINNFFATSAPKEDNQNMPTFFAGKKERR
jgi:hypothetical protein